MPWAEPFLPVPGPESHKYNRGMVAVIGGAMPGAAELAALSAMRAGAGYVLLLADGGAGRPHAIVRKPFEPEALSDRRIGALIIGPGLGRGADAGSAARSGACLSLPARHRRRCAAPFR